MIYILECGSNEAHLGLQSRCEVIFVPEYLLSMPNLSFQTWRHKVQDGCLAHIRGYDLDIPINAQQNHDPWVDGHLAALFYTSGIGTPIWQVQIWLARSRFTKNWTRPCLQPFPTVFTTKVSDRIGSSKDLSVRWQWKAESITPGASSSCSSSNVDLEALSHEVSNSYSSKLELFSEDKKQFLSNMLQCFCLS